MHVELLVFDLDGTLIDSKLDLALSVNATRAGLNLPPLSDDTVFSYVGNGAPVLIRKAIGEQYSEAQLQRSLEFFLNYYRRHMLDNTRLYPGAEAALERLQAAGLRMAVLTNKPVRFSRDLLRGLGVADRFRLVYGGNSFETKKPHPEGLSQAMAELGARPEQTMVVGDSAVDVRTARNAGAWACGVTYGFQPETFAEEPPDLLVDSLPQLADVVIEARRSGAMSRPTPSEPSSATPPQPR
ncbi:MAG TPA: phosphoglycolate phosphatase [Bryobacterales bacterium]|nr:phosphoglycolate phosphatase [Bryobacterales bacterium]